MQNVYYKDRLYNKLNIDGTFSGELKNSTTVKLTNSDKSPFTAESKTIDASSRTKATEIIGNSKANSIIGGKGKDIFIYTAGKDVITDYASGELKNSTTVKLTNSDKSPFTAGNKITHQVYRNYR